MLSPETFDGQPQQCPVDVWACGCCVYELVVGEHPFSNGKVQQTVKDHLAAKKDALQPVPFEDALRQSCTFKRTGTRGSHNLEITEIASVPNFNSVTGGFRDRGDFTKATTKTKKKHSAHMLTFRSASKCPSFLEAVPICTLSPDRQRLVLEVATRFSKNERFVERFEELAVAVTSSAVQVGTALTWYSRSAAQKIRRAPQRLACEGAE